MFILTLKLAQISHSRQRKSTKKSVNNQFKGDIVLGAGIAALLARTIRVNLQSSCTKKLHANVHVPDNACNIYT